MALFKVTLSEYREEDFTVQASEKIDAVIKAKHEAAFKGWDLDNIEVRNIESGL